MKFSHYFLIQHYLHWRVREHFKLDKVIELAYQYGTKCLSELTSRIFKQHSFKGIRIRKGRITKSYVKFVTQVLEQYK